MGWLTLPDAEGSGWSGLWSALFTAERAVCALVRVTSLAEALDLIWLADELADDRRDLTRTHAAEIAGAVAVDFGPLPADHEPVAAHGTVARLVSRVIARADELAAAGQSPHDALWLAGVGASLFAARARLAGTGTR